MFRELRKGVWFYIHAIGGAAAGYFAATFPNGESTASDGQSVAVIVAIVAGAVIGWVLWLAQKYANE